ncbi:MAG: valS [Ignavibacteria bacterium]|nr:valS [Ignavibacteria bacterium]
MVEYENNIENAGANFPKTYSPSSSESKWYAIWQKNEIYRASNNSDKKPYSILMPPPNVTGILHFGHVLNNTIQDLYIRRKRMQGYEVCWFPGTDHAGIATQTRVERALKEDGLSRYDLGREKFISRVWEWKEHYGGIILEQLRRLGISCDWSRTIFTMDESASNAVREVFIRLFDDGLIYKGKRIINWSPLGMTALSDEEVEFREVREHLFTLRYKSEDGSGWLNVATVRPETIFGDVAVAVNPDDERYKHLLGTHVFVPLTDRLIPIIADNYADQTFGTGCVKITPAHDPNDFEVGLRHNLDAPNSINPDGTLNNLAGEFAGLERFEARKQILKKLKEHDLVEKIEDYTHNVGFSQRGGEPVEPYLSEQWFVSMKPLAEIALKPVMDGSIRIYPNHWVKTYEHWLTNIRDWCISRQLWWGHRIPVYYTSDGRMAAASNETEARKKLNLPDSVPLKQDDDVLDTWFSSWLWPMTTMHWMEKGNETTDDLEFFLPTDLLVTAPDIIFFWVARMIMASGKFTSKIPFRDIYFTSTIRDGLGRKLSKSLGNSPDPLNIIDKYGTDAVRFTTLYLSPLGQDVRMEVDVDAQDIPSMELGRNFANKIWNAGRFLMMKRDSLSIEPDGISDKSNILTFNLSLSDKWILSRFNSTVQKAGDALDNYKITDYTKILYDFIWRDFCDWYLEILKVEMKESTDESQRQALMNFTLDIFEGILLILHPIMPFLTEELWHLSHNKDENESISLQSTPNVNDNNINLEIEDEFEFLQLLIEEVRRMRQGAQIPPGQKLPLVISVPEPRIEEFLNIENEIIAVLGRCSEVIIGHNAEKPQQCLSSVVRGTELFIVIGNTIDLKQERERLMKEKQRLENNIAGSQKKLENEQFIANAPEKIIAFERKKLDDMRNSLEKVIANLNEL